MMPITKRDICDVLDYISLGFVWSLAVLFVALTYDIWITGGNPGGVPIFIWAAVPVILTIITMQGIEKRHKQSASVA